MEKNIEDYIKKNFTYNPLTGEIARSDRRNSQGSLSGGYLYIKVKGKKYRAHRIAWLLYYGHLPSKMIDHINRDKLDNRIANLREATYLINNNNANRKINEDTGYAGVYINKQPQLNKKYRTRCGGKIYSFYTLEEAINFKQQYKQNILL